MPEQAFQCLTCSTRFASVGPVPQCNFCGEPTCAPCRRSLQHQHLPTDSIEFGFCPPCLKVQRLEVMVAEGHETVHCSVCRFEWTPNALKGTGTENDYMICCWCGARQRKPPAFPVECKRCTMILV